MLPRLYLRSSPLLHLVPRRDFRLQPLATVNPMVLHAAERLPNNASHLIVTVVRSRRRFTVSNKVRHRDDVWQFDSNGAGAMVSCILAPSVRDTYISFLCGHALHDTNLRTYQL